MVNHQFQSLKKPGAINLLYIALAPIQNSKPYELMHKVQDIKQTVLYLKISANDLGGDEFENKKAFDNIKLDGYDVKIATPSRCARKSGLLCGLTYDVWKEVKSNDVIVIYGHHLLAFWIAIIAARFYGKHLVLTTDATSDKGSANTPKLKSYLKGTFLRFLYKNIADAIYVPSSASSQYLQKIGIRPEQIVLTPYTVNEDYIQEKSDLTNSLQMRSKLGIPKDHTIFIFCAKFIARKRPQDAINALAKLQNKNTTLLMVGSGPLEGSLRDLTSTLNLGSRVCFVGLIPYSELPSYYSCSDVLVFPSEHEPYGLPVNEMMLCGHPVIVSDKIGARLDLVVEAQTGWTYPVRDTLKLSEIMDFLATNPAIVKAAGERAKQKMNGWTSQLNVDAQITYFKKQCLKSL